MKPSRIPALFALTIAALSPLPTAAQHSGSLEQRVSRLERLTESRALVNMLQRLDALQRDIQALQGVNEVQDHTLSQIKRRQRELYADVDRRLQGVENGPAASPAAVAVNQQPATAPVDTRTAPPEPAPLEPEAAVEIDPVQERNDYRDAFALLRDGHHQAAIAAFEQFLTTYPSGRYAANAQYWIGEAYYVDRQFEPAMAAFERVIATFPNSGKVPDAMLKIGYIHAENKRVTEARKILRELSRQHPKSSAAGLAKQRLQDL